MKLSVVALLLGLVSSILAHITSKNSLVGGVLSCVTATGSVLLSGIFGSGMIGQVILTEPVSASSIADRIKKVIAEQLGVKESEVSSEAHIVDELGADSLDTVELVMALEEEFELQIPEEELQNLLIVKNIVDYIISSMH